MNRPPHPAPPRPGRLLNAAATLLLSCLSLPLTGCQNLTPLPPIDPSQPDWTIRQGQAVWTPGPDQPETIGELWIALHPSGDSLVQFTKTPFPLVSAQHQDGRWQLQFGLQNRTLRGEDPPPARWLWLHVADALAARPLPHPLQVRQQSPGEWRLLNTSTSEEVLLVLDP